MGAAAKFDIGLAQRISADIQDEDLKNLATARIAVAQTQATFAVRKPDGHLMFTRLGDFNFNPDGTMVNELGYTVQGYLLGEDGQPTYTWVKYAPNGAPTRATPPCPHWNVP